MLAPAHMLLIIFLGCKDLIMQPKNICNQTVAIPSPPCLSTYLSVYVPTCLPTCLATYTYSACAIIACVFHKASFITLKSILLCLVSPTYLP